MVTQLTGIWKGGKSTFLAHYFRAAVEGDEFITTVAKHKILLVTEENEMDLVMRRHEVGLEDNLQIMFWDRAKPDLPNWVSLLKHIGRYVRENGIEVVVFDSWMSLSPVRDENVASECEDALNPVRTLASQLEVAVMLVHHPRKSGGDLNVASRGTGQFQAGVSINVSFTREGDAQSRRRRVRIEGRCIRKDYGTIVELAEDCSEYTWGGLTQSRAALFEVVDGILPRGGEGKDATYVEFNWPEECEIPCPSQRTLRRALSEFAHQDKIVEIRPATVNTPALYLNSHAIIDINDGVDVFVPDFLR